MKQVAVPREALFDTIVNHVASQYGQMAELEDVMLLPLKSYGELHAGSNPVLATTY